MQWHCLQCWQVLFFLLFLTNTVCLRHLWDVRPYIPSLVFLISTLFIELLFWSILRMVLSILRGRQSRCLSFWWVFCYVVWFRIVFSFSWVFFSSLTVSLLIFPSICKFPFLRTFWFCLDLVVLFLPFYVVFRFLLIAWRIFYSKFHSCISSLPVLDFPILSNFWKTFWCRPCTLGGRFFYDIWSLYPPVNFLSMWLSGTITITNSYGASAYPWKISLWIFTSVKLFPPAVSLTLQFSMVFSINFMTS